MSTIKRFPWLSPEDAQMLRLLPPESRREMENLLHQQAREQARFSSMIEVGDPSVLEFVHSARGARGAYGTGGGAWRNEASLRSDT